MKINRILFKEKRLLSRMETPEFREQDISAVKAHKEEKGQELDTKSVVDKSNNLIQSHSDEFEDLPPEFNQKFHDEVVKYFISSPSRYDKDTARGLNESEFSNYRSGMLKTLVDMVAKYAPSKEDKEKMEKLNLAAEKTKETAKKIKPLGSPEAIPTDPGQIITVDQLGNKYEVYQNFNNSLKKESAGILKAVGKYKQTIAEYKKERNGIGAYKKTLAFFAPERDTERLMIEEGVSWAKQTLAETMERFQTAKSRLEQYGAALSKGSIDKKQQTLAERDEKLKEMDSRQIQTAKEQAIREKKHAELSAHREKMLEERENISKYREEVENKYSEVDLKRYGATVQESIGSVKEALKSKNLTDEQRHKLELAEEILVQQSDTTNQKISGVTEAKIRLVKKDEELGSHIEKDIDPTLIALDVSINTLGAARLKYASSKDEVMKHYQATLDNFDKIDQSINESILQNNLANDEMFKRLSDEKTSFENVDVSAPHGVIGLIESTVTPIYAMIGGGIMEGGEYMINQGKELHSSIELANKQQWLTGIAYAGVRGLSEIIEATIGFTGGAVEIVGGLINMTAHPIDTLGGIGALIGRNPENGQWTWDTMGSSWKEMGKVIISYDDFANGRIGLGIGKIIPGVVLAIETAGAGAAGKVAAISKFKNARLAGQGVTRALAEGGVAFTKEAVLDTVKTVKSVPGKVKSIPGKAKEYGSVIKDKFKKPSEVVQGADTVAVAEVATAAQPAAELGRMEMITLEGIKEIEAFETLNAQAIAGKSSKERSAILIDRHKKFHEISVDKISNQRYATAAKFESAKAEAAVRVMGRHFDSYQQLKTALKNSDQSVVREYFKFKKAMKSGRGDEYIAKLSSENPTMANGFRYIQAQGEYLDAVKKIRGLNEADNVAHLLKDVEAQDKELLRILEGDEAARIVEKQTPQQSAKKPKPIEEPLMPSQELGNVWLTADSIEDVTRLGREFLADLQDQSPASIRERLAEARKELFENSVNNIKDKALANEARSIVQDMGVLEKSIADKFSEFKRLEELLSKGDKKAVDMVSRYLKTIDEKHLGYAGKIGEFPVQWQDALRYIANQKEYMRKFDRIKALQKNDEIAKVLSLGVEDEAVFLRDAFSKCTNKEDAAVLSKIVEKSFRDGKLSEATMVNLAENGHVKLSQRLIKKLLNEDREIPIALFENGQIPLDIKATEYLLKTRERIEKLEKMMEGNKVKYSPDLGPNELLGLIKERLGALQMQDDIGVVHNLFSKQKDKFASSLEMALRAVESGHTGEKGLVGVLKRLKEKDPEGFSLLQASDAEMLAETECLQGMLLGNKIKFENVRGENVIGYGGRHLGSGGFGEVHDIAYIVEGETVLRHGAVKNAHATAIASLDQEIIGALEVNSWNCRAIIKAEQVGDTFIIYETGIKTADLGALFDVKKPSPAMQADHLQSLIDIVEGLEMYSKKGFFHSDIKEANILKMKVGVNPDGTPKFVTKIIDNSPVKNESIYGGGGWQETPGYAFNMFQLQDLQTLFRSQRLSTAEAARRTGIAIDARAYGQMVQHAFQNIFGDKWANNQELNGIVAKFMNPVSASEASIYRETVPKLKLIMEELRQGRRPSIGASSDDIITPVRVTEPATTRAGNKKPPQATQI